jgi:uncharacterized protein YegP (UPF0339 family)
VVPHPADEPRGRLGQARVVSATGKQPDDRTEEEGSVAAKFVIKQGSTGKYRFNLVAPNGQVIATSETYESKDGALNGIDSVKRNASGAKVDDETKR